MLEWVELAVVTAIWAIASMQAFRIAQKPVVWRIARAYPLAASLCLGAGLGIAGGLVWALYAPIPRRVVTATLGLGIALAAWRARPENGAARGVPPGSLGLGASLDAMDERGFYERQAECHGPVFKTSQFGQPVVCVMGSGRGRDLLLRQRGHLEGARLPYADLVPEGVLRYMSDEDHREIGRLFRATIAETDLEAFEANARSDFRRELAALARDSARSGQHGVRAEAAIGNAVIGGLIGAYLGLAPDSSEQALVRERIHGLDLGRVRGRRLRRDLEIALADTGGALRRAQKAGSIAPTSSLGKIFALRPDALDDAAVAANLVLILRMAYGDMTALLHWVLKMLSDNPAWMDRVRASLDDDGTAAEDHDLSTRIVMETLRLEQSEFLYRRAAHDFDWEGYRIPRGWLIRVCTQENHRDPAVFEDPLRFDPDRFARRTFSREEYSPFGADTHGCMGPAIVHFLGRLFVEELARGFAWQVIADGPPGRGIRHWQHWTPNPSFRIQISEHEPC